VVNNIFIIEIFSNMVLVTKWRSYKIYACSKEVDVFPSLDIREHIAIVSVAEIVDILKRTFPRFSKDITGTEIKSQDDDRASIGLAHPWNRLVVKLRTAEIRIATEGDD